ncbi:hypothetical protein [Pengzhenrongella phosphoraccumulans]|uniref:hypothetical protein n=1 Tax=Pengzhenrongella phosphoraccumulans TaxID=3114394 RepID=UPI00388DEECE
MADDYKWETRMTQAIGPAILYITDGSFADAVVDRWSESRPAGLRLPLDAAFMPWRWPYVDAIVLVTAAPADDAANMLDEICATTRIKWMPVAMDEARIFVGPAVSPGISASFDCFLRRGRQHARFALDRGLPRGVDLGYAPHDVALTAALAEQSLAGLLCDDVDVMGTVVEVDLVTGLVQRSRVIPVNNSPRRKSSHHSQSSPEEIGAALHLARQPVELSRRN